MGFQLDLSNVEHWLIKNVGGFATFYYSPYITKYGLWPLCNENTNLLILAQVTVSSS